MIVEYNATERNVRDSKHTNHVQCAPSGKTAVGSWKDSLPRGNRLHVRPCPGDNEARSTERTSGPMDVGYQNITRREYRCRLGLHGPGCGGSTPPSRRGPCGRPLTVATF